MNILRLTLIALALAILTGCGPAQISPETAPAQDNKENIVATADNYYELTMSQLTALMAKSAIVPHGGVVDTAEIARFLDSVVVDTLVGWAAYDVRLEDDYEQYRIYRMRYHDALIDQYLKDVVYNQVEVDSQEVVDFYNSRPDLFSEPEKIFVYHILLNPRGLKNGPDSLKYRYHSWEEVKQETARLAKEIRDHIDSRESFIEAARKYSHDTLSGNQGGVIGWAARGVYVHPFDSVAFALNPGETSQPYEDDNGWHLIYVDDRREAGVPPLNERQYMSAWVTLRTIKSNELGQSIFDTLFANMSLEYNEPLLDTNLYKVDKREWLAVVNGEDTLECNDALTAEYDLRLQKKISNTTPEQKREMLRGVAQKIALVQQARRLKVDENPDVVAAERFLRHKYSRIIVEREKKDFGWQPSDSMVEQYYQAHLDEFSPEKPLVVQHIIVQDSLFGDFIRSQAMSGYDFLDLAKEYYPGDEDVRAELADLGEIGRGDVPDAFYEAALRVMVGEVTHPVKTEYGYHVIKVVERREMLSLKDATPRIVQMFKKQHAEQVYRAFRDKLFAKYNVRLTGNLVPVELPPVTQRS
ncbi:MAG: peptidylprolyl isomerase [Candidatus Zixiibacteriota bacterium]